MSTAVALNPQSTYPSGTGIEFPIAGFHIKNILAPKFRNTPKKPASPNQGLSVAKFVTGGWLLGGSEYVTAYGNAPSRPVAGLSVVLQFAGKRLAMT